MKLNLDAEVEDLGIAFNLAFVLMSEAPNQEVGSGGTIYEQAQGKMFSFTRNEDSYTIESVNQ